MLLSIKVHAYNDTHCLETCELIGGTLPCNPLQNMVAICWPYEDRCFSDHMAFKYRVKMESTVWRKCHDFISWGIMLVSMLSQRNHVQTCPGQSLTCVGLACMPWHMSCMTDHSSGTWHIRLSSLRSLRSHYYLEYTYVYVWANVFSCPFDVTIATRKKEKKLHK